MKTTTRTTTLTLAILLVCGTAGAVDPPSLVNYQGVLRDAGGDPEDGSFDMIFRFFDTDIGGDELLVDTHDAGNGNAVTVNSGLFNVQLGGGIVTDGSGAGNFTSLAEVIAAHGEVWLGLQVDGETLAPRVRVISAAYALTAATLQGKAASEFVDTSATPQEKTGLLTLSGGVDLGVGIDDDLTAADVTTLTDGGSADLLHLHSLTDADTVDGIDSGQFLRSDTSDTFTSGTLTTAAGTILDVDGSLYLDGELFMDVDGPDGLQVIYFYNSGVPTGESILWDETNERFALSGNVHVVRGKVFLSSTEELRWDAADARFEMTDDLALLGTLRTGSNSATPVGYNSLGNGTPDSGDMTSTSDLYISTDLEVDSQLYLNGEIRMDDDGPDGTQTIYFYNGGVATGEFIQWDDTDDRFVVSDGLRTSAAIQVGTSSIVAYSKFGAGTAEEALNSASDVYISDDLEIDGTAYLNGLEVGGTAVLSSVQSDASFMQTTGNVFTLAVDSEARFMIDADQSTTTQVWTWYHNNDYGPNGALAKFDEDGDLRIAGTLSENVNFDLAESFWMAEPVEPGDLVAVDPSRPDAIRLTSGEGDRLLVGVVSRKPGVLLGGAPFSESSLAEVWGEEIQGRYLAVAPALEPQILSEDPELRQALLDEGEDEVAWREGRLETRAVERFFETHFAPVALSGRVPVKVDTRFGEIQAGDALAPSPIPGVAMAASGPGPIVGTALESFSGGSGQVLTLIHRGYYSPSQQGAVETGSAGLEERITTVAPGPQPGTDTTSGTLPIVLDRNTDDSAPWAPGAELFRVDQQGNVWARGSFRPTAMDLAEYFPVTEPVTEGDVLVVDRDAPGQLRPGAEAADPAVVGIVSGEPGVLLGSGLSRIREADASLAALLDDAHLSGDREEEARLWGELESKFNRTHAAVALSGTVVCKVDAGYGAIEIGDLLTTSPTPGHAMRADDPRPGTIIGKAIERIDAGTGLIRVLVMLR